MQGRKRLKVFLVVQGRETRPSPFFALVMMVWVSSCGIRQIKSRHYNQTMIESCRSSLLLLALSGAVHKDTLVVI
jgi:hypothetical protein